MNHKFPIGKYQPQLFTQLQKEKWLLDIKHLPEDIEHVINNLDEFQLDTPYREGGWTIKQLIHHIADSHMNSYIRFKLALTEENPTIKPYDQDKWVLLNDINVVPINVSITLLHSLHLRWYESLKNLSDTQWQRTIVHPEHNQQMTLWYLLGMYAWHGKHHVAHILKLREKNNW